MRTLSTIFALFSLSLIWAYTGCSGGGGPPSSLQEGFLNYTRHESISFGVSGTATCPICTQRELTVLSMQIEVVPKNDPMHSMGLWPFNGLGTFTIPRLSGEPDTQIEIIGTLYLAGSADENTISGYAESTVPGDNGDIVGVTIVFPSQSSAD